MNDAVLSTSPAQHRKTVGNSLKPIQTLNRAQNREEVDETALNAMWIAFERGFSPSVANPTKLLTSPQISLYGCNYGTLIPNSESGEVTVSSGNVVEAVDYYPFGEQRIQNTYDVAPEQNKFTGHEYDGDSDLTYMKARYYDQDTGKFLSQDPAARDNPSRFLSDPQQLNSYSYARNNPLALVDQTGEASLRAWLLAPGLTGAQVAVGKLGAALLSLAGRPASAQLFSHSFNLNPGDIYAGNGSAVVNAIQNSPEYNSQLTEHLQNNPNGGTFTLPLTFESGDAKTAIHKIDLSVTSTLRDSGGYDVSASGSDLYNYGFDVGDYSTFLGAAANMAYFSQTTEALSNFDTYVNFSQQYSLAESNQKNNEE